jgi:sugar lactone lactonase YvrE
LELRGNPEPDLPDNRFNDAKCDRQGRFWAGTMGSTHWSEPVGSLYRFDPDGTITRMHGGVACANGMDWSPDSRVMYFTESFAYRVWAFDFDAPSGTISQPRVFAEVDRSTGAFPDGLTVDALGYVWSVHNAVGRVARYAPDGRLDRVIAMPVPRPCGCALGGPALDTLFVTTARETMTPEQIERYPLSGSLLATIPGVRGLPEAAFGG